MNKTKTNTTVTAYKEFGYGHFDILEKSKRLVRATLKTYDQTGAYVFLKIFKKATEDDEFECVQRISLTKKKFFKKTKFGKVNPSANKWNFWKQRQTTV